jgi:hypothetical protein
MNLCGTVAGTDSAPPGTTHTVSQGLPLEKVGKPRAQPELDLGGPVPQNSREAPIPSGTEFGRGAFRRLLRLNAVIGRCSHRTLSPPCEDTVRSRPPQSLMPWHPDVGPTVSGLKND